MQDIYWLKIFSWIDQHTVNIIVSNAKIEKFDDGNKIIQEWDESNGKWYIIKSGTVSVQIGWTEVAQLWVGEIFGEIWLLSEDLRIATVQAIWDVETLILDQDDIIEMINNGNESINKDLLERIEKNLKNK